MRVLIAEDDSVSRHALATRLNRAGYDTVVCSNGGEAWNVFTGESPPLLAILDWIMPVMDGLELCRRIRIEKRRRYIYIILLTSMGGKNNYLQGIEAGADDFLTKPFDTELLRVRLNVAERLLSLQAEVNTLQALLPICMYCKKIRDEREQWTRIEEYISQRTDSLFSHGVCPDCYAHASREMNLRK
ncbi:MAG: response regulator [Gammaproteobacteria bacterium]